MQQPGGGSPPNPRYQVQPGNENKFLVSYLARLCNSQEAEPPNPRYQVQPGNENKSLWLLLRMVSKRALRRVSLVPALVRPLKVRVP